MALMSGRCSSTDQFIEYVFAFALFGAFPVLALCLLWLVGRMIADTVAVRRLRRHVQEKQEEAVKARASSRCSCGALIPYSSVCYWDWPAHGGARAMCKSCFLKVREPAAPAPERNAT